MREQEIPVKFEPLGKTVFVLKGTKIIEAAANAGISLNMPCGGQGTCGKCRVRVLNSPCEPTAVEMARLSLADLDDGFRLACQSHICGPATVEVPETSMLASTFQILGAVEAGVLDVSDVAVRKRFIELPEPSRDDETPDLDRLQRETGPCAVSLELLRELPGRLRASGFKGTVVLADHALIDFEPGNTQTECLAAAFDVGTTTVVGTLLDLTTGRECASVARMNAQTSYGDDVVSRILHASQSDDGLNDLNAAIIDQINDMIAEMAAKADIPQQRIYEITFAGNTTMQHLLERVNPAALGAVPFPPATGGSLLVPATELGLRIHPRGRAYIFPVIGGFVGGDTVSCLIATRLAEESRPVALMDIGTNGEIVVCHQGKMWSTSTAAGPAFEGARIRFGMRAARGAIEKFLVEDGAVRVNVFGDAPPVGLCGSALIDVAAELLRHGALMSEGLLLSPDLLPDHTPAELRERLVTTKEGTAFVLARDDETGIDGPVLLTQADIRELQLAVAAMRAGLSILVQRAGLTMADLEQVYLAGGFGNFIRRNNAQRIGLLPAGIDRHRISFVGNASLVGARLAAVSRSVRERAEKLARRVRHVDLSLDPSFQMEYIDAMMFPYED